MANIKQQKKRIGQDAKRRAANAMFKSSMKTAIRRVETAADSQDQGAAQAELGLAFKKLDKALSKGILHKNNVARQKSYLQGLVNDLKAGQEVKIKNKPKVKSKPPVKSAETPTKSVAETEETTVKEESPEA